MLARFKPIDDSTAAVRVAYACSLAPDAVTDLAGLIQVSQRCSRSVAHNEWGVGAVLFRSGRLEEALEEFEKAPKAFPLRARDLLFLAMIHARMGHTSEARRCLQLADQWIVEADKTPPRTHKEGLSWRDLTEKPISLHLRREAEEVIRFGPVFPANPFAPRQSGRS
jgi:hypothetical protein